MKKLIPLLLLTGVLAAFFYLKPDKSLHPLSTTAKKKPGADSSDLRNKALAYSLDTFFTNRSVENGFSGSVLIALKGEPVYEKCFGYCNYRNKDLMRDTAAFQLASVSKTFTATAILWCAEHHLLSLDDTLQKFFPGFPYPEIRVKDLLCHRSGLPNYLYFCSGKCGRGEYLTNAQVIDIMKKQKPARYALPNRKFEYCNTNYLLLASIIEKVSKKRFKDFMRETFFVPLGMKRTFIYDYADTSDRKIAVSYNSKWEIQYDDCFDGVVGDKGVYSTVNDMFIWDQAFYQGKLLSQEMMKEAYEPRSFEKPGIRNYGYGWRLIGQHFLVYHNGWWHGNNTVFYRNIRDTSTIIILSNRYNHYTYNVKPLWALIYGMDADTTHYSEE